MAVYSPRLAQALQDALQFHLHRRRREHVPELVFTDPLHQVEPSEPRLENPVAALGEGQRIEGIRKLRGFELARSVQLCV